ncbi:MAG: tRNA 2-thiouridine(34) synthase MnmA [Sphaerochaetaceae bacterium]|jgi:tRNA-specific 2-thiouridylase
MRVLVGLSGGIDSAVTALLLKKQGYDVVAATMSTWREGNPLSGKLLKEACFGPNEADDIAEAKRISSLLDIEYHVLDCAKEFERIVLEDFKNEYLAGRTPNPCVWCNAFIKFGALPQIAKEKGLVFDKFATGHYANIVKVGDRWALKRGKDHTKDQTYFLYRLSQQQLSQTLFPLGSYTKEEVKKIAYENNLFTKEKKESQDFYGGAYNDLLHVEPLQGKIVDTDGKVKGTHQGYWNYTIGQRRGLGVSAEYPLYVIALDAEKNQVIVGYEDQTFQHTLKAREINWIVKPNGDKIELEAKIRSTSKAKKALLIIESDQSVEIKFAERQKAITPGQSIVFYKDDIVIGGALID